jgi:hypothetical protein
VQSYFGPFGNSVRSGNIGAWFALNAPLARKSFQTHSMVLLGDEAQVEARFTSFVDSADLDAI